MGEAGKDADVFYRFHYVKLEICRISLGDFQGFMQDKIIASHTCFGGHMDVNC